MLFGYDISIPKGHEIDEGRTTSKIDVSFGKCMPLDDNVVFKFKPDENLGRIRS